MHGLRDRDVAGAPSWAQVYDRLAEHLNGRHVVAYDAEHDQQVLERVCRRNHQALFEPEAWHDAMRLYAVLRGSRRPPKLATACKKEGIPVQDAHSAAGDCRMTLELLRRLGGNQT